MEKVIVRPILSEKSMTLSKEKGAYVFEVEKNSSKINIKNEIEKFYKIDVVAVRTMIYYRETKSRYTKKGFITGKAKSYKKAIVKLKEGQSIDIYNL